MSSSNRVDRSKKKYPNETMRLLLERGIPFEFREETDAIKMRDGVIFCPFERLVQGVSDPLEAYDRIRAKLAEF